jgi:hypothetical protein
MSWGPNATWPLARLLIYDDRLEIRLRSDRLAGLLGMSAVVIPFNELIAVGEFGFLVPGMKGIRFHTQTKEERKRQWDSRNGVVFWQMPGSKKRILAALSSRGVDVPGVK